MPGVLIVRLPSLLVLAMAAALWTSTFVLLPMAMADHTVQPASSSTLAQPSLGAAGPTTTGTLPASPSTTSPAATAAAVVPPGESGTPAAVLPHGGTPAAAAATAVPPGETPASTTTSEPTTTTAADTTTAPKKFPLPGAGGGSEPYLPTPQGGGEPDLPTPHGELEPGLPHGGYNPAAEVAGALPVPTPDELPSGASLGFGNNGGLGFGGPGDECCGGGGYGWFGGPGGFGPGTYGYSGPLYWGAATAAAGLGRLTNVVLPLMVAYAYAAIFA